ncbi:hypothetical protein POSPLADRAFT_1069782 [Postia placenta MAD-698-R-SB12]|uniref:Uncharacterized protein n=1 Tax=Postia placenta MAD-698-R-SB12 TaxID=670580 RepID=A0A1X6N3U0_9APHY|nr:hypothetical protein POSPLADRAFT_1069782 [Postia placenta MAD-698-R-SB12]OSX63287.1 hypothetical protein POSPLADRAFT_1069782 [Postia placenta MAD-698-R-SB12]
MSTTHADLSMSSLSLNAGETEDWDRSLNLSDGARTPRNSVAFPAGANVGAGTEEARDTPGRDKRTLSELLKLHSEKGKDVTFSPEEASRIAEVLGQWINSGPSPYEGEDDFFTRAQDDSILSRRSPAAFDAGRPRGQSESVVNGSSS